MIKRLLLFLRLARQGESVLSLWGTIKGLEMQIVLIGADRDRLIAALENIASVSPIGGQRRMLAKKAIQDTPQAN